MTEASASVYLLLAKSPGEVLVGRKRLTQQNWRFSVILWLEQVDLF